MRLKIGDTVDAAMGPMNIGEILSDQGRLDEAEAMFRRGPAGLDGGGPQGVHRADDQRPGSGRPPGGWMLAGDGAVRRCAPDVPGDRRRRRGPGDGGSDRRVPDAPGRSRAGPRRLRRVAEASPGDRGRTSAVPAAQPRQGLVPDAGRAAGGRRRAFEESLEAARSRQADFEIALSLHAKAALARSSRDAGRGRGARKSLPPRAAGRRSRRRHPRPPGRHGRAGSPPQRAGADPGP